MFKSAKRNKTEGAIDRIAGRVLQAWGALTGRKKHKAKGKAARARGGIRSRMGDVKSARR
jgi:uncharacterized protein YjbJ (UPF0337 family)